MMHGQKNIKYHISYIFVLKKYFKQSTRPLRRVCTCRG